ncbi:MAG: HD domain-containing protein [Alphaproteobacteria bacterium]|nr:HD domain-containing protein [Alphaproteobacteria bacterium]
MSDQRAQTQKVSYRRMKDGTQADYALMMENASVFTRNTPDRVLTYLDTVLAGVPGEHVDTREHSLQTATRAFRDEADEETVVAALLHDIGVPFAPANHDQFAAEILRPYVGWDTYWMVRHHGLFQGYYYFHHVGKDRDAREKYRGHPAFEKTVAFCEDWDQASFDPNYDSMPLSAFEPMVRQIFDREPWAARTTEP